MQELRKHMVFWKQKKDPFPIKDIHCETTTSAESDNIYQFALTDDGKKSLNRFLKERPTKFTGNTPCFKDNKSSTNFLIFQLGVFIYR